MYFILANTRMTPGPQEGIKVWVGGKEGGGSTFTLSPEPTGAVGGFPSNFINIVPRGLEPEVVRMSHVAPGGPWGRAPRGKK